MPNSWCTIALKKEHIITIAVRNIGVQRRQFISTSNTSTYLICPLGKERGDRIIHSVQNYQLRRPVAASEVEEPRFLLIGTSVSVTARELLMKWSLHSPDHMPDAKRLRQLDGRFPNFVDGESRDDV